MKPLQDTPPPPAARLLGFVNLRVLCRQTEREEDQAIANRWWKSYDAERTFESAD